MADIGEKATEREFKRLKAKIKDVYQQAYEDIYKKNLEFVKRHEKKEAQYRQMLNEGRISQADFDAWMRGQVFQGNQWEAKRKQMQETLLNADKIARQMINDSRYSVFADNANFIGYELEKGAGVMTSFGLYDANSVRRLLMEEPDLLPPRKIPGRDESYKWYNRQIQTAITQGIIQGEKIEDIAKRVAQETGESNMNAALRNARTMHTGAQNAGRIEGMHQAQRLGINLKKQWMSTLDGRTRDAHRDLDGKVADVDEPFKSALGKIMYPGDHTAHPGNVWNCRCTLVTVYPEYPDEMMKRRNNETGRVINNITYREWERRKRAEQNRQRRQQTGQAATGYTGAPKKVKQTVPAAQKNQFGYDLTEPGKQDVYNTFKATDGTELKVKIARASEAKPNGTSTPMKDKADFDIYTMPDGTRMHFLSKLDTKKQTLTPDKLIKAWYDIPEAYRKQIQKDIWIVDYQNPEDAYWAKEYKRPNFKSYMVGGDDITIWDATHHSEDYLRQALCHEGGHLIDVLKDGTRASESKKWKKAMADDKKHSKKESPTEYGKSHVHEDFAESCALYIRQPSMMKKDFPARTKLITELLNGTFKK